MSRAITPIGSPCPPGSRAGVDGRGQSARAVAVGVAVSLAVVAVWMYRVRRYGARSRRAKELFFYTGDTQ